MLKQRISDIDFKNDFKHKINKSEQENKDAQSQLTKTKTRVEKFQKEINDLKIEMKNSESKFKQEMQAITKDRDELAKHINKVEHKEIQYKHEIKNRELQVSKLQEQLKAKLFDKKGKENVGPNEQ